MTLIRSPTDNKTKSLANNRPFISKSHLFTFIHVISLLRHLRFVRFLFYITGVAKLLDSPSHFSKF